MAETVQLKGFKELARKLRTFGDRVAKRHLVRSLFAASKPIVADAKRRAPVLQKPDPRRRPGTLQRNIRAKSMRPGPGRDAAVKVGVRKLRGQAIAKFKAKTGKAASENPNDPFYAGWVERGTSKMAARPFLRPALESQRDRALEEMRAKLTVDIEAEARRPA